VLPSAPARRGVAVDAAKLQFIRGVDEPSIPEVSLRRARTGTSGQAIFLFENPSIFQASGELGDITGAPLVGQRWLLMAGLHCTVCERRWCGHHTATRRLSSRPVHD
jgi:hypothetical protein